MTKQDYINLIVVCFKWHIIANSKAFKNYCWNNNEYREYLKNFYERIRANGLTFSEPYHANGIGNNNEYRIFLKEKDKGGFIIEKNIAKFHYTLGVFGGISLWLNDYDTGERLCSLDFAR